MRRSQTVTLVVLCAVVVACSLAGCPTTTEQEPAPAPPPQASAPPSAEPAAPPAPEAEVAEDSGPQTASAAETPAEPAVEDGGLTVVEVTGDGQAEVQAMAGWGSGWSEDEQIHWYDIREGDTLVLSFAVATAGEYEVVLQPTVAPNYGVFTFAIDEGEAGEPVDLWAATVGVGDELPLGTLDLAEGEHTLTVTALEKTPVIPEAFRFGVDDITLR